MKNLIYRAFKIAIGVILAIFLAETLGLLYSTTAGVIAMLSIFDTRKQTYVVGIKRMIISFVAIIISSSLFYFGGHDLMMFGLFLIVFIPLATVLKSSEGLTISTVLVTHIYTLQSIGISVVLNEMGLVAIGVAVAWVLNLHILNVEDKILHNQVEVEALIRVVLEKMALQLRNQCSMEEPKDLLQRLEVLVSKGYDYAVDYNNNFILKDHSYFIRYFQMRRQQLQVLRHMEKHFDTLFVATKQAIPLSEFTLRLANELNEYNTGEELLRHTEELRATYRQSELPQSREEFENRATLYQYLNDIVYFIEIKSKFMELYGEIRYR